MREKHLIRGTDEHLGPFVIGIRFDMQVVKGKDYSRVAPVRVGGPKKFESVMADVLDDCFQSSGMVLVVSRKHRSNRHSMMRSGVSRQDWEAGLLVMRKLGYVVVPVKRFRRLWH